MPLITAQRAEELGYPKNKLILQTILIPKYGKTIDGTSYKITIKELKKWLKDNDFRSDYHRTTTNFHRFMQTNPIIDAQFVTKKMSPYLEFVYQKY